MSFGELSYSFRGRRDGALKAERGGACLIPFASGVSSSVSHDDEARLVANIQVSSRTPDKHPAPFQFFQRWWRWVSGLDIG